MNQIAWLKRDLDILGRATGPLAKVSVLAAVFGVVRFTEDELPLIKVKDIGNGSQVFEPPFATFGIVETQLEDAQAAALQAELSSFEGLTVHDVDWFTALMRQLEAPSVKARKVTTKETQ